MKQKSICMLNFFICLLLSTFVLIVHIAAEEAQTNGFIAQGYLKSSDNNYFGRTDEGTYEFNEIGVTITKDVSEKFRLGVQFAARDFGEYGNQEIKVDWGYGDYMIRDWLGVRGGKLKIPFGLYNETRDIDALRTCIILPIGVYNEVYRDVVVGIDGVGIYGLLDTKSLGSINYLLINGTENIDRDGPLFVMLDSVIPLDVTGLIIDDIISGSIQWITPLNGLRWGITFTLVDTGVKTAALPEMDATSDHYVFSVEYAWRELIFAYEYYLGDIEISTVLGKQKTDMDGFYGSVSYRVNDWFQIGAYYTEFYPNVDDRSGRDQLTQGMISDRSEAWQKDFALTTKFDLNMSWCLKFEGHFMNGLAFGGGVENDNIEEDWFLFASKLAFIF